MEREPRALDRLRSCQLRHGSRGRNDRRGFQAVGYYFTEHNYAPFLGDLVGYLATNVTQVIDNRGPSSRNFTTIGPGFRTHIADNWYLLGAVEIPVTYPQPYDYQVLGGIMKVY